VGVGNLGLVEKVLISFVQALRAVDTGSPLTPVTRKGHDHLTGVLIARSPYSVMRSYIQFS
jgi:hypothetical protein